MLTHLQIRNFALIDALDVQFAPGLQVLTGETGAGKSIIIDALSLALGGRAHRDVVRAGATSASVQAAFFLSPHDAAARALASLDLSLDFRPGEEELILRREVSLSGPNRCWVNGQLVTVAQLQQVAAHLVEIHGQHDQQVLMSAREQLRLLDQFGGEDVAAALTAYAGSYRRWQQALRALEEARMDQGERARRIDLLRYQIAEIDGVAPQPGEEEALQQERQVLLHAERLASEVQAAYDLLHGTAREVAAADAVAEAAAHLQRARQTDERLGDIAAALEQALVQLQETAPALRRYLESLQVEPGRLDEVETRLSQLQQLKRKYGPGLQGVIEYRNRAAEELRALESYEERQDQLAAELHAAHEALVKAGRALTERRLQAAAALEKAVLRELSGLRLGEPRFHVRLQTRESDPDPFGFDHVEFLFSANPGEEPKPLAKIASGGELSRVMLAFKAALAQMDSIPTLIFDEVDAGIGGETAVAVAERLAALGRHRQVLCITHLPQVAAKADRQFVVSKELVAGRTRVTVTPVEGEERVRELARMLGSSSSETTLRHARTLLESR